MVNTYSIFYYGYEIDISNQYLDFDEGGGELTATIAVGSYSLQQFLDAVKTALDAAGGLTYTVSVDRATRLVTISAGANFTLKVTSGSHAAASCFGLLGFSGADKTGTDSYTGSSESGTAFEPQFWLQDYIASTDYRRAVEASVNTTASGSVEVVTFGTQQFVQMNIRFQTDIAQSGNSPIKNDVNGVDDLRAFMQHLITKAPVEFMPNINQRTTYETLILESSSLSRDGIGYRLRELYNQGLPGYYDTGVLTFRVV